MAPLLVLHSTAVHCRPRCIAKTLVVNYYYAVFSSLSYLFKLSMPRLTFKFHNLQASFSFSISCARNLDMFSVNIVCKGSSENETGPSYTFKISVGCLEVSANLLCAEYPQWNIPALFPAKYVLQIPSLLFFSVIAAALHNYLRIGVKCRCLEESWFNTVPYEVACRSITNRQLLHGRRVYPNVICVEDFHTF